VAMEDTEDEQVDGKAGNADGDDRAGIEFGCAGAEAPDGFEGDVARNDTEKGDMDGDGKDFDAGVAEGSPRVGRAASDGGRGEGEESRRSLRACDRRRRRGRVTARKP